MIRRFKIIHTAPSIAKERTILKAFPPIVGTRPHTLILGTMPGVQSLEKGEYYAHPQNKFWPLMADIFNFDMTIPYEDKVMHVKKHGIAIWDVLQQCERVGSLDTAIRNEQPSDLDNFLHHYNTITRIIFDSGGAEKLFKRYFPHLLERSQWQFIRVPSPSPAHARLTYQAKRAQWKKAFE